MEYKQQVIALQAWYDQYHRDLCFRKDRDPYHIWVSEVMAQQTQIVTMTPYYLRWMEQFPTIEALHQANIEQVLMLWHGLGYYTRARNLKKGADTIMEDYGGTMPKTYQDLLKIPGIGPYIAAAIASICYDEPITAIDGNVNRVVARLLTLDEYMGTNAFKKQVEATTSKWMDHAIPHIFSQSLMELGALVCTPKNPRCEICPLQEWCQGKKDPLVYPKRKVKAKSPTWLYHVHLYYCDHHLAIQRPPYVDHLMEGYYRFPMESVDAALDTPYFIKHVYSHLIWQLYGVVEPVETMDPYYLWVDIDTLKNDYPLVIAHKKLLMTIDNWQ